MNGAQTAPCSEIRVGPAGWSYPDWAGYVYPSPRPKGFHEATYLAEFFDTIEINTSFYSPLQPGHAHQWLERVAANPRFLFTAKLWQKFTHETFFEAEGGAAAAPARSSSSKLSRMASGSTGNPSAEDERVVRAGFDVLRNAGKLGAVLLQFPFSFHRTSETTAYLTAVLKRFADYPLAVEVRHASWDDPEIFALLREHHAAFCNIDQPIIGKSPLAEEEVPLKKKTNRRGRSAVNRARRPCRARILGRRSDTSDCTDDVMTPGSATTRRFRRTNATTIFIPPKNLLRGRSESKVRENTRARFSRSRTTTILAKGWSTHCN